MLLSQPVSTGFLLQPPIISRRSECVAFFRRCRWCSRSTIPPAAITCRCCSAPLDTAPIAGVERQNQDRINSGFNNLGFARRAPRRSLAVLLVSFDLLPQLGPEGDGQSGGQGGAVVPR